MRVSDIYEEVKALTGDCSEAKNLNTISRAIQLLSNKGLFDPLIGYVDISVDPETPFVALPREVKTVLRVNINNKPSFARSRVFEFALNSEGSVDEGEENGLTWADRGYSPIQQERKLPGKVRYKCDNIADVGKTITITGRAEDGREIQETISAVQSPNADNDSTNVFVEVTHIFREATGNECYLLNGTNTVARFYGDETEPSYRVIKTSKTGAAVRVMFRRQVFKVTSQDSFIPLHSEMAVIHAAKAVSYYSKDEYGSGDACIARAVDFIRDEQASRDEGTSFSQALEIQTAIAKEFNTRDGIIVGDVYDVAAEIYGPIGRGALLDKITTAIEVLANKTHWDAGLGLVDIRVAARDTRSQGGLFVLPRFVETPVSINYCGSSSMPKSKWFEFHVNGPEGSKFAPCSSWVDAGEVCIINPLPLVSTGSPRLVEPVSVVAVPDSADDDATEVRIYGLERLSDGREIEVWRDDEEGWLCPCVHGSLDPGDDAPEFVRIDRITKGESKGFIKLYGLTATPASLTNNFAYVATVHGEACSSWTPSQMGDSELEWSLAGAQQIFVRIWQIPSSFLVYQAYTAGDVLIGQNTIDDIGGVMSFTVPGYLTFSFTPDSALRAAILANDSSHGINFTQTVVPISWASSGLLLGDWYPDEVEPKYRAIKLNRADVGNLVIRVLYRKRTKKLTSIAEPIPLRSKLAIELMLRSLKAHATDPGLAVIYEGNAVRYLGEAKIADGPSDDATLQFDESVMPCMTGNID